VPEGFVVGVAGGVQEKHPGQAKSAVPLVVLVALGPLGAGAGLRLTPRQVGAQRPGQPDLFILAAFAAGARRAWLTFRIAAFFRHFGSRRHGGNGPGRGQELPCPGPAPRGMFGPLFQGFDLLEPPP